MQHPYAVACKVISNKLANLVARAVPDRFTRSRILMFHDVVADGLPLSDEYACSIGKLCEILETYRLRGFQFVSLDTLLDTPYAAARNGLCVVTFDDGRESLSSLAAPVLSKLGVPFTVYVTTGWLGQPGYLTSESLKNLASNPLCTVGSHTVTHPMTRFLAKEAVTRELALSRDALYKLTGRCVEHFAFPYGSAYACSLRDVTLAARCGYKSAALTTPMPYVRRLLYANYRLPRLNMPFCFDTET